MISKRNSSLISGTSARRLWRHAGFTIVECMIVLAITAILMTAVAVAFNASAINYQENERMFKALNSARQALERMTSELRTAGAVDVVDGNDVYWAVNVDDTATNTCQLHTALGRDITYEYRPDEQKLYLITNDDSSEYVLCDGVTAASFLKTPTEEEPLDCKSVQISLTVDSEGTEKTLVAAVVIRKNLDI